MVKKRAFDMRRNRLKKTFYASKRLHSLLFFFLPLLLSAQKGDFVHIRGTVLDAATQAPIPYASLRIDSLMEGTLSNKDGEFELLIKGRFIREKRSLVVSCIGYQTGIWQLQALKGNNLQLALTEQPYALDDVLISYTRLTAPELVKRAFEQIPQNYSPTPYTLNTFYRHYCKEGKVYGRLIEAAVTVQEQKGHKKPVGWPTQRTGLEVKQLRRSFDFTRLYAQSHAPISLNKMLMGDWVSYKNPLTRHPELYLFHYKDTTYLDGHWVYVIGFQPQKEKPRNYSGLLYISADDLAFVKIDFTIRQNVYGSEGPFSAVTQYTEHHTTHYQKAGAYYYLSHMRNEGKRHHELQESDGRVVSKQDHFHHIDFMVSELQMDDYQPINGKEPSAKQLLNIPFDPDFWQGYNQLKATPLEQQIAIDLQQHMPLDEQFRAFNARRGAIALEGEAAFDQMLEYFKGRVTYVQFYHNLALGKLNATRRLAKRKYADGRVMVLFVYVDEKGNGLPALIRDKPEVMNSGLLILTKPGSSLLKRYGVTETPHFMILDRNGQVAVAKAKAPDEDSVTEQIDRILLGQ